MEDKLNLPAHLEMVYQDTAAGFVPSSPILFRHSEWPGVFFNHNALEAYHHIRGIVQGLIFSEKRELAEKFVTDFRHHLEYLSNFGGGSNYRIVLSYDWAPLSFSLAWYRRAEIDKGPVGRGWAHAWNGGMIWHGGNNDPLCVRIGTDPNMWGIHT